MKLRAMEFTIKFDRPVDPNIHYISPGGYILNNKQFDFCHFEGNRVGEDRVRCEVSDFDFEYAKENGVDAIVPADIMGEFTEFFIYTGEYNEPELIPVEIEDISFYFDDTRFICPPKALKSANECLAA